MKAYKKYMAELVGAFTLVFIAAGAVCADFYLRREGGQGLGLLGISIAYGVVMIVVIYATSYISGSHVNPAVTISFWISKRMDPNTAIMYILSQITGAIIAGLALKVLFPEALNTVYLGTCMLSPGVSIGRGILMEFIVTFFLVFTVYGTLVDKRATAGFAGVAIGMVTLFGAMIGGTISGGAMNPARVFGPAIASGQFTHHYVWWIGPILGGIVAGFVYDQLFADVRK
ncbi:MAG: aquaporin [Planctomycetia bacterium]|uniref:Aquaporin n=1 Tax=Candidatus Brocadia sapporoensis TaxID=392547 RepID=A0A1V6M172_9BACT|nr:aquaporin [Candidatus Brocadia sapporoensis]MCC7238441.1 aquaporin [Candidatus Brocadia sp.]QOJ05706.1 MAG: aquaporin [Planctomycetia bacterium]TVL95281.1 MAG: aquaporin [Candidatus Brocadia sp. BL1]MDG6005562.1 aquaporin [Candidatus Brocadia sp.]OQD46152.1 aquaporin [Candidatus Brocadia sapporoensis]